MNKKILKIIYFATNSTKGFQQLSTKKSDSSHFLHNGRSQRLLLNVQITHYSFCSGKDKNSKENGQKKEEKKSHTPKVIEISKQQLSGIKKFVQKIRDAMPTPNMPSVQFNSKGKSNSQKTNSQNQMPFLSEQLAGIDPNGAETYQKQYFSSKQHKLSFKLLKFNQVKQMLPVFKEFKDEPDVGIKLMILYRFWALRQLEQPTKVYQLDKYAKQYIADILTNLHNLSEIQLSQFLTLYLTIHQSQKNTPSSSSSYINPSTIELPRLPLQSLQGQKLPLIKDPTNMNSSLIILLLQFLVAQRKVKDVGKQSIRFDSKFKQLMIKVLSHYKLKQQQQIVKQGIEANPYQLKDIAHIAIYSSMCELQDYNALPMLIQKLNNISTKSSPKQIKQCIKSLQFIIQNVQKLSHVGSPKILGQLSQLLDSINTTVANVMKIQTNPNGKQKIQQPVSGEEQDIADAETSESSGTLSSLLYTCLLVLQKAQQNIQQKWSITLIKTILTNLQSLTLPNPIPIQQYAQFAKSCSILHKLRSKFPSSPSPFVSVLSKFLPLVNPTQCIQQLTNPTNGNIIEQNVIDMEVWIFQCLVAYRVLMEDKAIGQDGELGNERHNRTVLKGLIRVYRTVIENMFGAGMISAASGAIIHNIIITTMIAQYYSQDTKQTSMLTFWLSPTIVQILQEYGVGHQRFGAYVSKLLTKNNLRQ